MSDREPCLLLVEVDGDDCVWFRGELLDVDPYVGELLPLHYEPTDDLLADVGRPRPQPCTLGCTAECPSCLGHYDRGPAGGDTPGDPVPCPDCTGGTFPAVHATEDECRPPLPEEWLNDMPDDLRYRYEHDAEFHAWVYRGARLIARQEQP